MSQVAVIEVVEQEKKETVLFDQKIQDLIGGFLDLGKKSFKQVISVGKYLVNRKEESKHGEWTPYLEANGIERRTASNFMKTYQLFLEGKYDGSQNITDLLRGHHKTSSKSSSAGTTERANKPINVINISSLEDIGQGNKAMLQVAVINLCKAIAKAEKAKKPMTSKAAEKIVFKAIND